MEKSWVWLPSLEYEQGATDFVYGSAKRLGYPPNTFCPCLDCRNLFHQPIATVLNHLVIRGMDQKYKRNRYWSHHGEIRDSKTSDEPTSEFEAYELFKAAYFDGDDNSQSRSDNADQHDMIENEEESEFMKSIKVKSGMSENYFDQLLKIVHNMLPEDNLLLTSTDAMKKFLKIFGFGYENIHAYKNDCIMYWKKYEDLTSCPRCNASRWKVDKHTREKKTGILVKVLRYILIKDRFKRMYRSRRMAEHLRWHFSNASGDGTMRHPVDSITWAQINDKWPQFASKQRNLRLGLSTDGMNPFLIQNTKYSIWPVLLVNYNMPPTLCMKAENERSDQFRDLRKRQIPHTTSRKGMVRLGDEMKKKASNPSKITRSKIWIAGHTHAYGRPVRPEFEQIIEQIKSLDSEMGSNSNISVKEDVVSKVLGKDKTGRVRGMGRGITSTKLAFIHARNTHVEKLEAKQANLVSKIEDLTHLVRELAEGKRKQMDDRSPSDDIGTSKGGPRCQLLDWNSEDDAVVGEGELCSVEPTYKTGHIPLGPNAAAVVVDFTADKEAYVWRPTTAITTLGQDVGAKIAWPFKKLILNNIDSQTVNKTAGYSVKFLSCIMFINKLYQ